MPKYNPKLVNIQRMRKNVTKYQRKVVNSAQPCDNPVVVIITWRLKSNILITFKGDNEKYPQIK